jgi:hypothetical protein
MIKEMEIKFNIRRAQKEEQSTPISERNLPVRSDSIQSNIRQISSSSGSVIIAEKLSEEKNLDGGEKPGSQIQLTYLVRVTSKMAKKFNVEFYILHFWSFSSSCTVCTFFFCDISMSTPDTTCD